MRVLIPSLFLLLMPACQMRVWQAKVPDPVTITEQQREPWAQAAGWIEVDYAKGHPDPVEGQKVATALSTSIGSPSTPAKSVDQLIKDLERARAQIRSQQAQIESFLHRQQGRTVEGSGFNLLGFTSSYWVWVGGLAVFLWLGGGPILIMVIRRTRNTLRATIKAIEETRRVNPQAVAVFENQASKVMDASNKKLVKSEKQVVKKEMIRKMQNDLIERS